MTQESTPSAPSTPVRMTHKELTRTDPPPNRPNNLSLHSLRENFQTGRSVPTKDSMDANKVTSPNNRTWFLPKRRRSLIPLTPCLPNFSAKRRFAPVAKKGVIRAGGHCRVLQQREAC